MVEFSIISMVEFSIIPNGWILYYFMVNLMCSNYFKQWIRENTIHALKSKESDFNLSKWHQRTFQTFWYIHWIENPQLQSRIPKALCVLPVSHCIHPICVPIWCVGPIFTALRTLFTAMKLNFLWSRRAGIFAIHGSRNQAPRSAVANDDKRMVYFLSRTTSPPQFHSILAIRNGNRGGEMF